MGSGELAEAQFVNGFEGAAAISTDERTAIAAGKGTVNGFTAARTIKGCGLIWALLHALIIVGCGGGKPRTPAIGEGYVAPISLNIRQELSVRAPVTAQLKHGERLEILERRRRFVKVRTERDEEGWTDSRQLLSPKGMARLRRASERAEKLPSQGKVSPFDVLNVHIEANRQAPSFYQIPEKETADVIGRLVTGRAPYVGDQDKKPAAAPAPAEGQGEVLKDDWTLIRLKDGRSGWVLSRMLMMNLPDEVTQYAEGHRITSYFDLGEIEDKGQKRHHWLWTTISIPPEEYQFDSLRVFIWNHRRHRYETAYRENKLRGYFPVAVEKTEAGARFRVAASGRDGVLTMRTYEFNGIQVKLTGKEPYQLPKPVEDTDDDLIPETPQAPKKDEGLWARMKNWVGQRWSHGGSGGASK